MPPIGGKRSIAHLAFPESFYIPDVSVFNNLSEKEVREEYSRLRSIARKRLERWEKTDPASRVYLQNKGAFPALPDIKSRSDLARRFADVARFVGSERSSIALSRALDVRIHDTLVRHGVNIDKKDLKSFGRFMEYSRSRRRGRTYDSDKVAKAFTEAKRLKVDPKQIEKNFDYFVKNVDKMEKVAPLKSGGGMSGSQLRRRLENL